jgi:hypothetical protein
MMVAGVLLLVYLTSVGGAVARRGHAGSSQTVKQARHLHDARYCEILELKGVPPTARAIVWNTIGLGKCPAPWWKSFDATSLAHELGDTVVVLNGPRHFLMDSATAVTGTVRNFHGQRLTMVASIAIHTAAELVQTAYTNRVITRTNTWSWNKGRTIFELIAPGGRTYVMQSYSQIKDPSLTLGKLSALGHRLTPPGGWHYRTRVLRHPLVLTARKSATIIQDELQNTYQLAPSVP